MHDPSPTADKVLVDRIQWLFLILFAIAISTLALGIYAAGHRVEINPGLPGLETKLDATRSRVEATRIEG